MELWTATKLAFAQFSTFTGKTSRADYWYFFLALTVASVALGVLSGGLWLSNFLALITIIPLATASARRLRDAGMSIENFFWLLVPLVGWIILLAQLAQPARDTK
jgi:uncharacterized membrane protein YhaH (DUF805 family)